MNNSLVSTVIVAILCLAIEYGYVDIKIGVYVSLFVLVSITSLYDQQIKVLKKRIEKINS